MQHVAQGLASLGRGGDTMLVHMSPDEVHGLQTLAMAAGGSLSVNPDTGLPEAFKLKSLLPMIAGAVATFFSGGTLAPLLAGAVTGAATGDKNQSLLMRAGLGALGGWGGGGIASALSGAGAAAGTTAATQGAKAASETAIKEAAKTAAGTAIPAAGNVALPAAVLPGAADVAAINAQALGAGLGSATQTASLAGQGLKAALMNPSTVGANVVDKIGMTKLGAAMAPVMAAPPSTLKGSKEPIPEYQMYTYNPGTPNPKYGEPGEPYFIGQGYSSPVTTNQNPFSPTYASYDKKGKGVGAPGKSPLELMKEQLKQQQAGYAHGGGISDGMESIGSYSDGGRLLRGPGDGVSDDIPATIHRDDGSKQEARLADGEFVFPARIVSEIGNGSTEAGAQKLYAIMDKIQRDRAGTLKNVAKDTNADRHFEGLA